MTDAGHVSCGHVPGASSMFDFAAPGPVPVRTDAGTRRTEPGSFLDSWMRTDPSDYANIKNKLASNSEAAGGIMHQAEGIGVSVPLFVLIICLLSL